MPAKNMGYSRGVSTDTTNRATSGASTASRASSTTPDVTYATNPQFARLREQSTVSETDSKHGAHVLEEFSATAASLQRYNSNHGLSPDAPLNAQTSANYPYPPHASIQPNATYNAPPSRPSSRQAQPRARTSTPQLGATGTDGEKDRKKGISTTAANEMELREMLEKNIGRTLESIAREVRNSERSQKSERAKQLYAMRW